MIKRTVVDIEVEGKRVLLRADLNVPLNRKTGTITDDTRIRAVLPTIIYLIDNKARVILCSHLGRPGGRVVEELRLTPVAQCLSELLGQRVITTDDCIGPEVDKAVSRLKDREVLLLENLRFHPEEEENDPSFAQALAGLADLYVNDAFGTTHRAHASTVGIAAYLPAVAGFLIEKELKIMGEALNSSTHPFALLIGGAKVSDKLGVLENILKNVDSLLIGGGMAATFLKARGYQVGLSLVEDDKLNTAQRLMGEMERRGVRLFLPVDVVIAERLDAQAARETVPVGDIPQGWSIADIGPATTGAFSEELKRCSTIVWNGPMGLYEIPRFADGTRAMARLLASLDATTVIGGGSTAEVVVEMGLVDEMTHVSTGGGASLRFLEGKVLPGIAVLQDKGG